MVSYRGWRIYPLNAGNKFTALMRGPANESVNLAVRTYTLQGAVDGAKDDIDRKLGGGSGNRAMAELAGAPTEAEQMDFDENNVGERHDGGPL